MKLFAKMFSPEGRRLKAASPYQAGDLKQAISFVIRVFVLLLLCYLGTLAWGVYLARQNAQLQKFNEQIYALNSHIGTLRDELNSNFLYIPDSMQDYLASDSNASAGAREATKILTRMTQLAQDMGAYH